MQDLSFFAEFPNFFFQLSSALCLRDFLGLLHQLFDAGTFASADVFSHAYKAR
ncbi:Hypothetical protein CulFRC58_0477 [Corynebacterium ulcerans FRC58]|uniref:Uncharacterized protein n=1 Tax=Corynebacterium ulcerans FRC58 TaxID=1408268 RepID=A0ABM5TYU6_CORUL|nr:Hypothetical protein CulFRC58_0477 [Corynebacterium ulcerans FRC58]